MTSFWLKIVLSNASHPLFFKENISLIWSLFFTNLFLLIFIQYIEELFVVAEAKVVLCSVCVVFVVLCV